MVHWYRLFTTSYNGGWYSYYCVTIVLPLYNLSRELIIYLRDVGQEVVGHPQRVVSNISRRMSSSRIEISAGKEYYCQLIMPGYLSY